MHGFLFPNGEQNEETEAAKRQNLNKPVVIVINGSGKLADLLSAYVARYQKYVKLAKLLWLSKDLLVRLFQSSSGKKAMLLCAQVQYDSSLFICTKITVSSALSS